MTQSSENWNAAPATVAVMTTEGSMFAVPVTQPGPIERSKVPIPRRAGCGGAG